MSDLRDGGPAFPEPGLSNLPNGEFLYGRSGMSLRDWFAGQALGSQSFWQQATWVHPDVSPETVATVGARFAYAIADAMIARRALVAPGKEPDES